MSTETTTEVLAVSRTIDAPVATVFGVLADPAHHAAIDGTGWVREPLDPAALTEIGQIFGMGMYHANHPDGDYRMHNRVEVFEAPRAIAWQPGQYGPDGEIGFGGWTWGYEVEPEGAENPDACRVTLTYDWSRVPPSVREHIGFPPFGVDHLERSLDHLAELAT